MSFLARIAGPRVLFGVVLAAVTAIGLLWWFYQSAKEDAAQAEQHNAQLTETLRSAEAEAEHRRKELERLQAALVARDKAIQGARQRAKEFQRAMEGLTGEARAWSRERIPDDVLDSLANGDASRLRQQPGSPDENDTPEPSRSIDAAMPGTGDDG